MATRMNDLEIEGACIIWRNFSGAQSKFNRQGNRNFSVVIDDEELANKLMEDGWTMKPLNPKTEDAAPAWSLKTKVSDRATIYLITESNHRKKVLDQEAYSAIDYMEIKNIDLVISPYYWEMNGNTGVAAYLKRAYITIAEDSFTQRYSDYDIDEEEPVF